MIRKAQIYLGGGYNENFYDELNSSDNELTNKEDKNDKNKNRESKIRFFSDDSEYAKTVVVENSKVSSIQEALDSITDDVGGDLLLKINSNIDNKNNKDVISIPTDKGIKSLTIGTDIESGIKESDYYDITFYANGIPITIDSGVNLGSHTTIYGGGADDVKGGGTSITVNEGAAVYAIFGGGLESDVNGDVNITVNGTVSRVYGGGYTYADDSNKSASANVFGNISIEVSGENSVLERILAGGGYAYDASNKDEERTLEANVKGNIEIYLDCPNIGSGNKIYGGGYAYIVQEINNQNIEANVIGDINITLSGNTKAVGEGYLNLWGGGSAGILMNANSGVELDNTKASATVTGDISVDASKDFNATSGYDDWDSSMFDNLYGGGHASGPYADATVNGNTDVITCREVRDSQRSGAFAGGHATHGSKARVTGNTKIEVVAAENAADRHESAKNVGGGGLAGFYGDAVVEGNTHVIIGEGVLFEGSGFFGVTGGGCVFEDYGCADVGGNVTVEISSDITKYWPYGGGFAKKEGSEASVAGDISIIIDGANLGGIYCGGTEGSTAKSSKVIVLGESKLYIFGAGTITNGITLNIGDGTTETHVMMDYIFDSASVHILDNAVLEHTPGSGYKLSVSNYVEDLQIDKGGTLIIENYSERISGNFIGGGTLRMKAGNTLTVDGTVTGETKVKLNGTPQEGELYIKSASGSDGSFALQHDELALIKNDDGEFSQWRAAKGVTVTVADAEHGTVIPSGSFSVAPGTEQTFTFKPEYGYKIGSLKVGGTDVTGQISDNSYTGEITGECTVEAVFVPMEVKDIQDVIENLPDIPTENVTEEQKESVLETKLHYEALPDDTKAKVPHEELSDLNDALMKLPEVEVEVIVEGDYADTPDSHMLLQSMTVQEAEGLLNKTVESYKISMKVAETDELSEDEYNALQASADAEVKKQYDITVNKMVKKAGEDPKDERLTKLSYPVTLVFDVSDELPDNGYRREWTVYNIHDDGTGRYTVTAMNDNDRIDESVTVLSDRFSVYVLSYKDTKDSANKSRGSSYSLDQSAAYRIIVTDNIQNGTVKTDRKTSESGKTVTITAQPYIGSRLDTITVTDSRGNELTLTGQDGRFEFIMPASDVTVNAYFTAFEDAERLPFTDVSKADWFYDAVKYVYDNNIMSGTSGDLFSPDLQTTRGMIVTILYRLEGQPKASGILFSDVEQSMYYADAVTWAAANGVVSGYGNGEFGPDDMITREQLVSVLYRYAANKGIDVSDRADIRQFSDAYSVSGYAVEAMEWAYSCGLISGMQDGTLLPGGGASRSQTAAMLMRYIQRFN